MSLQDETLFEAKTAIIGTENGRPRDSKWSESIAAGSKGFVAKVKKHLGLKAKGRKMTEPPTECHLREAQYAYSAISGGENGLPSPQNLHLWEVCSVTSGG
jgi:hypothetical protein